MNGMLASPNAVVSANAKILIFKQITTPALP